MKDITNILSLLLYYYDTTRGAGHTTTMMEGAKDKDCLLFCHTLRYGEDLKKKYNRKITVVTPDSIERRLLSEKKPLAIDNAVMYTILSDCLAEINRLDIINSKHWDITNKVLITDKVTKKKKTKKKAKKKTKL